MRLALLFPILFSPDTATVPAALKIEGPAKSEPYKLIELTATGSPDNAALIWDVSPEDTASVRELPGGSLVMTGPPGVYKVKLRSIESVDGKTVVLSARHTVTIGNALPPGDMKPDPEQATARIQFGTSGCTATVMWPRRADGAWDLLTASHCTGGVGSRGTVTLKDGRKLAVITTVRNTDCDLSWLRTESTKEEKMPYALLAERDPEVGVKVWHCGYGVDKPGNVERGQVDGPLSPDGQLRFVLSVSPGDSGGGIFREDNGHLVSSVCCTTAFARHVVMFGGGASRARALRPKVS